MSFETTVTDIVKIMEAGLFRPATPEQLRTRGEESATREKEERR